MMRTITDLRLEELTSRNAVMRRCLQLASFAAKSDVPVLILGRTGTGKTLLAQAIHNSSARAKGPFVSFNASAMSDTLLESELFGHERGAFTGALQVHRGKFETAHTGTLFLDEIADMSPLAQAKILRAVEYGEFERVGGERLHRSNVRIISATNCSLHERIAAGKFREDLYHRLDGLVLLIPPLCERQEDLPSLIAMELEAAAAEIGKRITSIHPAAMEMLQNHSWPGNLRELYHTMRSVASFAMEKSFDLSMCPFIAISRWSDRKTAPRDLPSISRRLAISLLTPSSVNTSVAFTKCRITINAKLPGSRDFEGQACAASVRPGSKLERHALFRSGTELFRNQLDCFTFAGRHE
jgi:transcriptional regulator with GAF, ATPase, and Fis domain